MLDLNRTAHDTIAFTPGTKAFLVFIDPKGHVIVNDVLNGRTGSYGWASPLAQGLVEALRLGGNEVGATAVQAGHRPGCLAHGDPTLICTCDKVVAQEAGGLMCIDCGKVTGSSGWCPERHA